MKRILHSRARGQASVEGMVAAVLFTLVAIVIAGGVAAGARMLTLSQTVQTGEQTATDIDVTHRRDASTSFAPFAPSRDIGGADNSDGHEFDFYEQTPQHTGFFWAYCYKKAAGDCQSSQTVGTIQRYTYAWSNLPQNGGSGATPLAAAYTNIGYKVVVANQPSQYADSSIDPAAAGFFGGTTPTFDTASTFQWGFPGVHTATNEVFVITLTLPTGQTRSFAVAKLDVTFGRDLGVGTATPSPNPMCATTCPNTSTALSFAYPIASAQTATITESNYGTRSTTPPQVYSVSGCNGVATYSPSSPVTPSSDGTGDATLTIRPIKQLAPSGLSCTITATDNMNQQVPITVAIGRTYTPAASGPGSGLSGLTATYTVDEGNYPTSPPGGFSASISGACNSISRTNAYVSGGVEYETWNVHFASTGTCTATFTDVYGQQAQYGTSIACSSYGTACGLSVSPTSMTIYVPPGGPGEPTSGTVSVAESNQYKSFSISNGCNGYASTSTSSLPSSGGSFTISATSPTNPNQPCNVTVSDSNGQSASVAVTVDPNLATPTPAPNPTPCASANSCWVILFEGSGCGDCSTGQQWTVNWGTMMDSTYTQTPNTAATGWTQFTDSVNGGSYTAEYFAIDTTYCNGSTQLATGFSGGGIVACNSNPPTAVSDCANNELVGLQAQGTAVAWAWWIYSGHLTNSATRTKFDFAPYQTPAANLSNIMDFNGFVNYFWSWNAC